MGAAQQKLGRPGEATVNLAVAGDLQAGFENRTAVWRIDGPDIGLIDPGQLATLAAQPDRQRGSIEHGTQAFDLLAKLVGIGGKLGNLSDARRMWA